MSYHEVIESIQDSRVSEMSEQCRRLLVSMSFSSELGASAANGDAVRAASMCTHELEQRADWLAWSAADAL